jgi:hypothetical protein
MWGPPNFGAQGGRTPYAPSRPDLGQTTGHRRSSSKSSGRPQPPSNRLVHLFFCYQHNEHLTAVPMLSSFKSCRHIFKMRIRKNITIQDQSCLKAFPMIERLDECNLYTPLWISWSNWMSSSLEIHFIIISFTPHQYNIPSIKWYILHLHVIRSTLALSSDGGWLSRNILIGLIQSYASPCSGSSMTIRSGLAASIAFFAALIESLVNFSMMTSDRVYALEEAIQAR